jgi:hypothetical protein
MSPLGFCPRRFDRFDESLNGDRGKIAESWFGPISALWTECGRSMGTIHLLSLRMGADRFGNSVSGTQFNADAGTLRRLAGLVSADTRPAQDRRKNK